MWNKKKHKKITKQIIVEKAMTDETYRQKLMSNPQNAIQEYFDITIPSGLELIVVEETDNRFYLVIPKFHNEDDLPYCDDNVTGTW